MPAGLGLTLAYRYLAKDQALDARSGAGAGLSGN
ncbi:hypothetical protein Thiowin_01145 [Thiorhodovibrio winogradskyi]|uniref:Uncharacterized protein n=1 Tax=Thiorhodovibrio winogradskyi TaxID=77007 RepID=A0ABZ0S6P9_9GAMM